MAALARYLRALTTSPRSDQGFNALETTNLLNVLNNLNLELIDGFNALKTIGRLFIYLNPNLLSMDGFGALESATEITIIENGRFLSNGPIQTVPTFPSLTTVSNKIDIVENRNLVDIPGFNALTDVKEIRIAEHQFLEDISGFNSLTDIGALRIRQNTLSAITGFTALQRAGRVELSVSGGPLTSLAGVRASPTRAARRLARSRSFARRRPTL